jgi:hypothetical protein
VEAVAGEFWRGRNAGVKASISWARRGGVAKLNGALKVGNRPLELLHGMEVSGWSTRCVGRWRHPRGCPRRKKRVSP